MQTSSLMNSHFKITFIIPPCMDSAWNIQRTSLWWTRSSFAHIIADKIDCRLHHEFQVNSLFMSKNFETRKSVLGYLKNIEKNAECISEGTIWLPYYLESIIAFPWNFDGQYFKNNMEDFQTNKIPEFFNFRYHNENKSSFLNIKTRNFLNLILSTRHQFEKILDEC